MHLHQNTTPFSNGIKVLLILLITYTTWCSASLTQEEIEEAMRMVNDDLPFKYCGKRLTSAMKTFCTPPIRDAILKGMPVKKSRE
jgi:hypothetical protein